MRREMTQRWNVPVLWPVFTFLGVVTVLILLTTTVLRRATTSW
jgi:hypothetical protein